MTDLRAGGISDLLPASMANTPEVKALDRVLRRWMEELLSTAERSRVWCMLEAAPGFLLDALATELRTPGYNVAYLDRVKRRLVMDSMTYYMHLGTAGAVDRLIKTILGDGRIAEWFNYGGQPHFFQVITSNPAILDTHAAEFRHALGQVKRLSAWLDAIVVENEEHVEALTMAGGYMSVMSTALPEWQMVYDFRARMIPVGLLMSVRETTLPAIS